MAAVKSGSNTLKNNGFSVEVHNQQNVAPIKRELGVPARLQSCHTAKVGDYVIEGHVPADLISKLLVEKPKIKGLAVPGMPMGPLEWKVLEKMTTTL